MNEDVIYVIGKFVDIREAKEKLVKEAREEIKMCELFDDIREEGKEEGRIEERVIVLRELGVYSCQIMEKLMERFSITEEKAWEYVQK